MVSPCLCLRKVFKRRASRTAGTARQQFADMCHQVYSVYACGHTYATPTYCPESCDRLCDDPEDLVIEYAEPCSQRACLEEALRAKKARAAAPTIVHASIAHAKSAVPATTHNKASVLRRCDCPCGCAGEPEHSGTFRCRGCLTFQGACRGGWLFELETILAATERRLGRARLECGRPPRPRALTGAAPEIGFDASKLASFVSHEGLDRLVGRPIGIAL